MEKLLTLTNSGESFEKTITLCYYAMQTNYGFYSKYRVLAFYGHNLPKKDKNINAHGTVGFYTQYLSNDSLFPFLKQKVLVKNKNKIIDYLLINGYITRRNADRLKLSDDNSYLILISKIPLEYLCPKYIDVIGGWIKDKYPFLSINSLYFERKFPEFIFTLPSLNHIYSIYSLSADGTIGRHYLELGNTRKQAHLCTDLQKSLVLSGNSALLLSQIEKRIGTHTIVGYRPHKTNIRPNREYAFLKLAQKRKIVVEPKNSSFNAFYSLLACGKNASMEEKANEAIAYAYTNMFRENPDLLYVLSNIKPEWMDTGV